MRRAGLVLGVSAIGLLVGCSGGSSTSTVNPLGLDRPSAVATTLAAIERGLRIPGEQYAVPLGQVQTRAYGTLVSHPEWRASVLAAVPADVQGAVSANLDAATSLESLTTGGAPASTLPPWTIRSPQPEATLLADYHAAEQATGIPWGYLAGIHLIESRLGRIMGSSSAGAQGPMQFEPATWTQYGRGGNVNDDRDAILAAGRLLAANGGPGNMNRALLAYNNDERYAHAVQDYATVLLANAAAFDGYYQWPVVYETATGTYQLPPGYPHQPAIRQG